MDLTAPQEQWAQTAPYLFDTHAHLFDTPAHLFDTHVHLLDERFDEDREAVIAALSGCGMPNGAPSGAAFGVGRVLEACCDEAEIDRVIDLCERHPCVYGSAGVHPHSAAEWNAGTAAHIAQALAHPRIVAVGEIGLDYHYDFSPRAVQKQVFEEQIAIAIAHRKPIIVHDREAHGDCMDILRAHRGALSGVMHCFSGSYETARESIDLGLYIAFGGALTFKNALTRRDIAARLPLDRLLIETDCPYMTPEPYRGKRNDPCLVYRVLEAMAAVRPEPMEQIAAATTANAYRCFGIEP